MTDLSDLEEAVAGQLRPDSGCAAAWRLGCAVVLLGFWGAVLTLALRACGVLA